jgi:hypothetical protein
MANDVYEFIAQGTCAGQFWETVQHYQSNVDSSPDPVSQADNLITGFRTNVEAAMLDCLAGDVFITGYKSRRVNNGGSPTVMRPITPATGTVSGTSATSATSACIVSAFSHASKFHTGRWFLPGIPESELTGNSYSSTFIASAGTLVGANASFSGGVNSYTFGVWSPKFSLFFVPAYVSLSPKPGIQRRRLRPVM